MTFCRLWEWASSTVSQLPVSGAGFCAGEDLDFAGEVLAGDGRWVVHDLLRGAFGDEVAAVLAGAGAEVEDVVGVADGVFVVLDDEDGVAEVAEVFEGGDEALVVALVEADGGLVEDVEDAAEAGADLGGEADALAFAAGEGGGGAVEGEVAEADGVEEFEALDDLALEAVGDEAVAAGEVHGCGRESRARSRERAVKSAMDCAPLTVTARDSGRRRVPLQTGQSASRTCTASCIRGSPRIWCLRGWRGGR